MYLVAGVLVPHNAQMTHLLRQELASYSMQRGVTMSMLEFAEKSGANTARLEARLTEVDGEKSKADHLHLDQDYDGVLTTMARVKKELVRLNEDAIKLKDKALFWVYVIEWFSVTATMLIAGLILWGLMIRRRGYREVKTTRFNA